MTQVKLALSMLFKPWRQQFSISFLVSSASAWSTHSSNVLCSVPIILCSCSYLNRRLAIAHTNSMPFRSGRWGTFQSTPISCLTKTSVVTCALWMLQLSSRTVTGRPASFVPRRSMNSLKCCALNDDGLLSNKMSPSAADTAATTATHF